MNVRMSRGLVAAALVAAISCSNQKTPVPGKPCLINSDCENPLSCTFGKCHEACRAAGDCPTDDELCVVAPPADGAATDAAGLRVCIADKCTLDSMCPDLLVCGRDLRCRQECETDKDCARTTDRCVVGGITGQKVCAQPDDIENGMLKGDAGVAADAGTPPGDGGGDSVSADGGSGGAPASDGSAGVDLGSGANDAPADAPASADTGAGSDAAIEAGAVSVPEMEPNDDLTTATPYTIGTEVNGTLGYGDASMDLTDFFEVTAPASDPSGGYFQVSVTNVGTGVIHADVYSVTDGGRITFNDGAGTGQSFSFYWSARPGQKYRVRLYVPSGKPATFKYTFAIAYARVDDPFEPNETRDTSRTITVGVPIMAYFFTGYGAGQVSVLDQDWFDLELAVGATTVNLQSVSTDERLQFQVANFTTHVNVPGGSATSVNNGADAKATFNVTTAGRYQVAITADTFVLGSLAGSAMVPDSFTRPYRLTVTQP